MQAILVKYLPATNYRPSRHKASCQAGSVTLAMSYEGHDEDKAAQALCVKLAWPGVLIKGQLPNGDYVYTFAASDRIAIPVEAHR